MRKVTRHLPAWLWVPSLYFAEGIPYVAVMNVCTIMYKSLGVSNAAITFFTAWLYLPWVVKPLWSPIVDILGSKRGWIVAMQGMLAAGFAAVAFALPGNAFFSFTLAAFWIVALLSATHDIAADGFYMLALSEKGQAFFVGIRTLFYRLALILGQGALVVLAGWLAEDVGVAQSWMWAFAGLSALFALLAIYHFLVLPRPEEDYRQARAENIKQVVGDFGATFRSFFSKPGIVAALAFMLLYRLPEAQLIRLIPPFLMDTTTKGGLALSTAEVGIVYGTIGMIGLMAGGVAGGFVVAYGGLKRWMMPMAWSMSLTCLAFVYLSFFPTDSLAGVSVCVFIEQLGYGFGGTAYTLYLIRFSAGRWSTSHYSLCTGVMALGMMLPGFTAGALQESVGYPAFFVISTLLCGVTIGVAYVVNNGEKWGE